MQGVSVKVRALIGKDLDPGNWHGDLWADPDEAEDIELNFAKY